MNPRRLILALALAIALTSCNDEDFVPPSFISIDAIQLVPTPGISYTSAAGFCQADIVSCYVEAYYKGSSRIEMLGLFELPFTAPVLYSGEVEYMVVSPAVKISGISGMQNYYPFYHRDTIHNLTLTSGDTLRLGTLNVTHRVERKGILLFEPFEYSPETATETSLKVDSITWHPNAPDEACAGLGYASVHVPDSVVSVPFSIKPEIPAGSDKTAAIYLELDTRSDLPFEVYISARYSSGGAIDKQRVMVVNPSDNWKHLYINLGRTWAAFNYPSSFHISFAALNVNGQEGDIRIDNLKIVNSTSY